MPRPLFCRNSPFVDCEDCTIRTCPVHKKLKAKPEKCPQCGHKGHLQGITLNGAFKPHPQKYKCKNGHEWPVRGVDDE